MFLSCLPLLWNMEAHPSPRTVSRLLSLAKVPAPSLLGGPSWLGYRGLPSEGPSAEKRLASAELTSRGWGRAWG